jgi:hypothetical protein
MSGINVAAAVRWTFALAILGAAFAGPAQAKETIGADFETSGAPFGTVADTDEDGARMVTWEPPPQFVASGGLTADTAGIITRFRLETGTLTLDPRIQVRVLRFVSGTTFTVGLASPGFDTQPGLAEYPVRIPIEAGQRIGLDILPGLANQAIEMLGAGDAEPRIGMLYSDNAPALTNTDALYDTSFGSSIPLYAADIEPDADGDGFGDETQDACPAKAAQQTPCPAPVAAPCSKLKGKARKRCLCKRKPKKARAKCLKRVNKKARKR